MRYIRNAFTQLACSKVPFGKSLFEQLLFRAETIVRHTRTKGTHSSLLPIPISTQCELLVAFPSGISSPPIGIYTLMSLATLCHLSTVKTEQMRLSALL